MSKASIAHFENLAAADDAVRLGAAAELQALGPEYFTKHSVGKWQFSRQQLQALQVAYRSTASDVVRAWIAQALILANTSKEDWVVHILVDALRFRDAPYRPYLLGNLAYCMKSVPEAKNLVISFHTDPDPEMRSRCAYVLASMHADGLLTYGEGIIVLRKLLLDPIDDVRWYAIDAFKRFEAELGREDFEALLDLENMDAELLPSRAPDLMDKISARVPSCTRADFAPRIPLLRQDGVYVARRSELDADGVWVSYYCLRFQPDQTVRAYGTNVAPKEFGGALGSGESRAGTGPVRKEGAKLSFAVTSPWGETREYTGEIEGSVLHLTVRNPVSGATVSEDFRYVFVDWTRANEPPPAPATDAKRKGRVQPFVAPPKSMLASDACKWYLSMLARVPTMLGDGGTAGQRLAAACRLKRDLRDAAAKTLISAALRKEFVSKLPVPSLEEVLAAACPAEDEAVETAALRQLLVVTVDERRAFPATVGESIGMTYWDGKITWEMTEQGWRPQA